jgi:transglutaminase-like putative cysteine protease
MQWASELRRGPRAEQEPERLLAVVLERLRTGGYSYTLEPGEFGPDTADEFWFDRKAGFCEHIASAFVIMMRSLDIPARIVTGYQGGEFNGVGGFWVVRQSDAHAWAEVWLAGQGWVRVDPTASVAPGRIGSLQRLQAPRGVIAEALESVARQQLTPTRLQRLRFTRTDGDGLRFLRALRSLGAGPSPRPPLAAMQLRRLLQQWPAGGRITWEVLVLVGQRR